LQNLGYIPSAQPVSRLRGPWEHDGWQANTEAEFLFDWAESNRVEGAQTLPEIESRWFRRLRPSLV